MQDLLDIMARLRDPDHGCPWDIKQTFESIAPYTIEEAYEVADAIDRDNMVDLKDELGDLLLQVVFHAQMAQEQGLFRFEDVAEQLARKMVRRHPHVFADQHADTAEDVKHLWETIKQQERATQSTSGDQSDDSALAGLTVGLPEWIRAQKLHKKAASVGFDWDDVHGVLDKVEEELGELREAIAERQGTAAIVEEYGDLLFACCNIGRHVQADPGTALRLANHKFEQRFRAMELLARARHIDMMTASLAELEQLWQEVKASGQVV